MPEENQTQFPRCEHEVGPYLGAKEHGASRHNCGAFGQEYRIYRDERAHAVKSPYFSGITILCDKHKKRKEKQGFILEPIYTVTKDSAKASS